VKGCCAAVNGVRGNSKGHGPLAIRRQGDVAETVGTAGRARELLRERAEPGRAEKQAWFFKTEPGGYGERDRFHGVRVPDIRRVASCCRDLPLREVEQLLDAPFHEERLLALFVMVRRYERGDEPTRQTIFDAYLARLDKVNNWDLVDASAPRIVGAHLRKRDRALLYRLAASSILWERRVGVLATFAFMADGEFEDALAIAEKLLDDEEDLIHKATGWMLREVGKRDVAALEAFLDRHHAAMPRTMLRYAIERLPPDRRAVYLGGQGVRRRPVERRSLRARKERR
jgi:3-methyladenine DNA glycosylase AlkD